MKKMFKFSLLIIASIMIAASQGWAQIDVKVSGRVMDASTGKPLAGANILIEQTGIGTASDPNGNFELKVPSGNYVISASFIGYEVGKQRIRTQQEQIVIDFKLRPRILPGQEVVITANRARERETPVAFVNLPGPELKQRYWAQDIPMLLAEVPGIYAYSDAGNGLGYTYLK
ncbi:MAG: carboxypeptidase-like regulatory domain-containing protein, partial [candidate division KSB1 bacterium]|nr:carboxypeptidase-like regulatory domain-containing protein [candidate division KSB1 bacterium]